MSISKRALWAVQQELYPESIRISYTDVLNWMAFPLPEVRSTLQRYRLVAYALQHPNGVWYRFPHEKVTGYRYGLKEYQYISNFSIL